MAHGERRLQPVHQLVCLSNVVRTERERAGHGRDGLCSQVVVGLGPVAFGGMHAVELGELEELLERGCEPATLVRVDRLAGGGETAGARGILDRPLPCGAAEAPQ